jgi:hypothetical protein
MQPDDHLFNELRGITKHVALMRTYFEKAWPEEYAKWKVKQPTCCLLLELTQFTVYRDLNAQATRALPSLSLPQVVRSDRATTSARAPRYDVRHCFRRRTQQILALTVSSRSASHYSYRPSL